MTRLLNDPTTFKDDWIDGLCAAYPRYVERVRDASGVQRLGGGVPGRVSVVIGGGCGHYPAFAGTVGAGLATAAVVGDVFTSPSAEQAYRVARAVDAGAGVLFSFGNYAGDVMNFGLAEQRLRGEGRDVRTVLVTDDVASAPAAEATERRGIAGDFPVFKIAGAAAERGDDLDGVERVARVANDRTRTLGVAFAGCTVPGGGEPLFTVADGRMELGLGIHGEPGISEHELSSASDLVPLLLDPLLEEAPAGADGRVAVVVNGLGSTTYEELFCVAAALFPALSARGLRPVLPEVGELVTSLDMAGCSLTLTWLDDELEPLWTAPADTPAFRRGDTASLAPSAAGSGTASSRTDTEEAAAPDGSGEDDPPRVEPDASARTCARTVVDALTAILERVRAGEDELGRIDAVAGDGDHGSGMVRGAGAAVETAESAAGDGAGPASVLRAAGAAWADRAGGTSGVLWGALLTALADHVGDATAPDDAAVAAGLRAGADALAALGRCAVGDKTMLDALIPLVDAVEDGVSRGATLADAWRDGAGAAQEAATATADLRPRKGRARPLAERSVGTPDPGATSLAWSAAVVADVLDGPGSAS